jgi:hypothetical protein
VKQLEALGRHLKSWIEESAPIYPNFGISTSLSAQSSLKSGFNLIKYSFGDFRESSILRAAKH